MKTVRIIGYCVVAYCVLVGLGCLAAALVLFHRHPLAAAVLGLLAPFNWAVAWFGGRGQW